jgi:hypothetical protein
MLTLVLATAFTQSKTVTFEHPCASSATVLEALGKQLGVQMKPSGSVMKDFIIVRFNEVPVEDAMKKLAESLNATWTQTGGVNYLTRTGLQENNEKREAVGAATKLVQTWLDKRKVDGTVTLENSQKLIEDVLPLIKSGRNGQFNEQAWQRQRELENGGPLARYLTRLLKEIGAATIADMEDDESVQYVENPSGTQRRLPSGEATKLFTVETAIYKEALSRTGALERLGEEGTMYSGLIHPYMEGYYRNGEKTVLTVNKRRDYYSIQFSVAGGGQINDSISVSQEATVNLPEALTKQEGSYEPTAVEKELGKAASIMFSGRGGQAVELSAESVAALSDPIANEPLTFFGSKWLLDASKSLNRNVVGVLSDDMFLAGMFMASQNQLSFAQFWTFMPRMGTGYKIALDDKWLTIYPSDPIGIRDRRIDREAWKRAISLGRPGGTASLEHLAAFAALSDDEMGVMIASLPAAFMDHGISIDALQRDGNLHALRLYGRLTAQQQKAARNGGIELLLSRLQQPALRAIDKMVNGRNASVEEKRRTVGWGQPNVTYGSRDDRSPQSLMPRGYPPASVVRFFVSKKDVIHQQRDENYGRSQGQSADEVGQMIVSQEVWPENFNYTRPFFAVAPAEQLMIEMEFTNIGYVYHILQLDFAPKDMKYVALAQLPAETRAELDAAIKKYREMYKNVKRDGGG